MVIDKIGNINNIIEPKKTKGVHATAHAKPAADSVQISTEGLKAAEEARYLDIVRDTPDVRREKIEMIKAQIANGTYDKHLDEKVLARVADKMLRGMFSE
jgi:flagellar biosynthesis anti-sigma factor FlgM